MIGILRIHYYESMDTLSVIVQSMTKAELRHFKLFARRGHDHEGRKDLLLFDWIRQSEEQNVKEDDWICEHYGLNGKNAYYRFFYCFHI